MRSMTPTSGTSPAPVLALDDMTSRDPSLASANAAALATARAAGLPVLDGLVIPVDVAAQVAEAVTARRCPRRSSPPCAVHGATSRRVGDPSWPGRRLPTRTAARRRWLASSSRCSTCARGASCWRRSGPVVASADGGPMAVLVQPFVVPAWGGVMFGADPVSGRTDRLVVSAVPGGPHRLVSGEVDGTQMTLSPHRHTRARTAVAALQGHVASVETIEPERATPD